MIWYSLLYRTQCPFYSHPRLREGVLVAPQSKLKRMVQFDKAVVIIISISHGATGEAVGKYQLRGKVTLASKVYRISPVWRVEMNSDGFSEDKFDQNRKSVLPCDLTRFTLNHEIFTTFIANSTLDTS